MRRTIAVALGAAGLLAAAVPAQAQAQGSTRLTKVSAEKRLQREVRKLGGASITARCRAPRRGRAVCAAIYLTSSGQQCADTRVTITRRRGRLRVKGLKAACVAPAVSPAAPAAALPEALPSPQGAPAGGPLLDPGAAAPSGPPPGAPGAIEPPPGAPRAIARAAAAASSGTPAARSAAVVGNSGFLGCTPWQADIWYGRWWMYVCYWTYSSAPPGAHLIGWQTSYIAQVYYWTGSQAAFWFRSEWTA